MKQLINYISSMITVRLGIIAFSLFSIIQINAQTIDIDSLSIKELMYTPVVDTIRFRVKNTSKDSMLIYHSYIKYDRKPKNLEIQDSLFMTEAGNTCFNTVLQYVDTAFLSAAYGNPDYFPLKVATRFTAGENGFNLSNIRMWFIPEDFTSGTIQVEIRAGGNSIANAIVVSQGFVGYEINQSEINGHLFDIKLNKEISMYPNEDFYILLTYPAGIARPQGCAVNETIDTVEGRYWIQINDEFVDLQHIEGYSNGAWLMYAAEESANNIGWLSFVENDSDSIRAGDYAFIRLQLDGLIAGLGSQYADVIISSNDTLNPEVYIPIELRLNEAPYFLDAPSDVFIKEDSFSEISITIKDLEEDNFSVLPAMGCKFVQFSFSDSILNLYLSPNRGDAGDYLIRFVATDEYGMSRELTISIHVLANQAPIFINPPAEINVEETKELVIRIEAYDPENDYFIIKLTDGYDFINSSFEFPSIVLHLFPQKGDAGNYTLKLIAQDTFGSERELHIPLHVQIKNRPPAYIGEEKPISFSFMDNMKNFDISDYFEDPDNDSFTFDIFCHNPNVVEVTTDNQFYFTLKPKSVGMTLLDFSLTDVRGEQSSYSIEVIVGLCENPDGIIIQKWNKTLLVNNYRGEYTSEGYQWYRNGIPIKNATRQDYSSEDDTGGFLDFTAEYFVRIVRLNGDTIFTCPCMPVQKANVMKVYPNPVAKGELIHIENDPSVSNSGIIQIVDVLGNIRKTIQTDRSILAFPAPDNPGLYIVRTVFGDNINVFRIKVY